MVSQTYLGNPNLKAKSVPVSFTKEEVQEYVKCSKDPISVSYTHLRAHET